jgi:hypothetical protein
MTVGSSADYKQHPSPALPRGAGEGVGGASPFDAEATLPLTLILKAAPNADLAAATYSVALGTWVRIGRQHVALREPQRDDFEL